MAGDAGDSLLAAQSTQFAPNEVALFDAQHPTTTLHSIIAAFTDAVLTSDHVQFLNGTQTTVYAQHGTNFIFATNDPFHPVLNENYTICGGSGPDLIFAGPGNVTVYGGSGNDLIAAGSGKPRLWVATALTCSKPIRLARTFSLVVTTRTHSLSTDAAQIRF